MKCRLGSRRARSNVRCGSRVLLCTCCATRMYSVIDPVKPHHSVGDTCSSRSAGGLLLLLLRSHARTYLAGSSRVAVENLHVIEYVPVLVPIKPQIGVPAQQQRQQQQQWQNTRRVRAADGQEDSQRMRTTRTMENILGFPGFSRSIS